MPGGWLAVATYLILWILLIGFVLAVGRAQRAQRDDLAALERRLEELARRSERPAT